MKILLIGGYKKDNRTSMNKFSDLMYNYLTKEFDIGVNIIRPRTIIKEQLFKNFRAQLICTRLNKFLFQFHILILTFMRKYDVIHILDQGDAFYSHFIIKGRIIVTVHDLFIIQDFIYNKDSPIFGTFAKVLKKRIISGLLSADCLVADSEHTKKDIHNLLRKFNCNKRIFIKKIYLGINSSKENSIVLSKLNKKKESKYLLHVGSNCVRKNKIILIEILNKVHATGFKINMKFVGESLPENIICLAKEKKLEKYIKNYSNISVTELNDLYKNAHALIFPSIFEGFGWPILEAQQNNCPVIANNATSISEVIGFGGVLINDNNIDDYVYNIIKLKNINYRKIIIQNGHKNCLHFSIKSMISNYVNAYRSI